MKVLGLLGTYHAGGSMDLMADAVLEGARSTGAKTEKIHLVARARKTGRKLVAT